MREGALALLALMGLLAWLFLTRNEAPPERAPGDSSRASLAQAVEAAPVPLTPAPVAREEVVALEEADGAEPLLGAANAMLHVRVVAAESRAALAGVRVTVHAEKGGSPSLSVESMRGTLTESPRTESAGEVQFEVPAGEALRLSARGESGEAGQTSLVLAPLAPGELCELVLELPTEPDLMFHGRVLDDASGAPIAGARLELREGIHAPALAGESAADGYFQLRLGSWRHALLTVSASGYAQREVPVTSGHETPALACEVRLARHASLAVRLWDGAGAPVVGALVVLEPEEDAYALEGGTIFTRRRGAGRVSATSDALGECRLEALPPDVLLRVEIQRDGRASVRDLAPITLRPGEERAVEWRQLAIARTLRELAVGQGLEGLVEGAR
ncbi:MAG: carboxypeptidase regulatory-like domain-containing protein, partial [Planctomycetota bacterium]